VIKNITVPTLVLNGVNEGASDKAIAPFVEGIPNVTYIKLHDSTHMPHWEERDRYIQVIGEWLSSQ
jgi:pimeloyl-ACP methyl ester carboxylesterase